MQSHGSYTTDVAFSPDGAGGGGEVEVEVEVDRLVDHGGGGRGNRQDDGEGASIQGDLHGFVYLHAELS